MVERHHEQPGRPEELKCLSSATSVIKQVKVDSDSSCNYLGNKNAPEMCRLDFEEIEHEEMEKRRGRVETSWPGRSPGRDTAVPWHVSGR
jgi:hypothetical protein